LTDVLSGAALGIASGLFIPRLTHSLPNEFYVAPTTNGVVVGAVF
jgi:hypothetical protein